MADRSPRAPVRASPLPLRRPLFGRMFAAMALSAVGDQFTRVAVGVLAYRFSGGQALPVGLVILASFAPAALFGIIAGPLVDRWHRGRTLVLCDLVRAVAVSLGFFADDLLDLCLVAAPVGLAGALFGPAQLAALPATVEREELTAANGLAYAAEASALMLGPALATWVIRQTGPHAAFLVDGATYVASALLLSPLVRRLPATRARAALLPALAEDLREGLRYHREHPLVWGLLVLQGLAAVAAWGFNALLVPLTHRHLGRPNAADVGLIHATMAGGLALGNLLLARFGRRPDRRHLLAVAYGGMGVLTAGLLWTQDLPRALPLFLALGLFNAGFATTHVTWLQERVPSHLLGRVFAFRGAALNVAAAASLVLMPTLADAAGYGVALWTVAALMGACSLLSYALPGLRTPAPAARPAGAVG